MRISARVVLLVLNLLLSAVTVLGQAKLPGETRNAALRYWQAFAELKDTPTDREIRAEMEKVLAGESRWNEKNLGPLVASNEIALGIMQRATKLPDCDWGVEYSRGPQASIAFVSRAHVLARINTLAGIRQAANGNLQAAVDTWIAGLRFTQDLTKGGSLLFALTAKSVLVIEMRAIAAEAKLGQLPPAEQRQLFSVFNALPPDGFDWGQAWDMDAAGADVFFAELQETQHPRKFYEELMGEPAPKGCIPPSPAQLKLYHAYMTAAGAALRLPPPEAKERLTALQGQQDNICESIRVAIPSAQRVNDERTQVIRTRQDLLEALRSK